MKICFVPSGYPNEYNSMACVFLQEQVKALNKIGHSIVVLQVISNPTRKLLKNKSNTISVINDGYATRLTIQMQMIADNYLTKINQINFRRKLEKLKEKMMEVYGTPDVVYAHFSRHAGYAAVNIFENTGIPVVVEEHQSGYMDSYVSTGRIRCLYESLSKSSGFISVSQRLKENIINLTGIQKEIDVIPNMIDDCFTYHGIVNERDKYIFLSVSNLVKRKRCGLLLSAFLEEFNNNEKVMLVIGGDGPEKKSLIRLTANSEREHQVSFPGRLNREETLEYYKNCDCFVLPSAAETYGIVYREAMAVGRPVITTNHGGFNSQEWSDDYGIMINVDDIKALRKAMRYMYENSSKYNGENISIRCLEQCSSEKVAKKIEQVLIKSINAKRNERK